MQLKHLKFDEDVSVLYVCVGVCVAVWVCISVAGQTFPAMWEPRLKPNCEYICAQTDQHLQSGYRMMITHIYELNQHLLILFGHYFIDLALGVRGGGALYCELYILYTISPFLLSDP